MFFYVFMYFLWFLWGRFETCLLLYRCRDSDTRRIISNVGNLVPDLYVMVITHDGLPTLCASGQSDPTHESCAVGTSQRSRPPRCQEYKEEVVEFSSSSIILSSPWRIESGTRFLSIGDNPPGVTVPTSLLVGGMSQNDLIKIIKNT